MDLPIFLDPMYFEEVSSINVTPARLSEELYKGDYSLMWYISESDALLCKLETIFINMLEGGSSLEKRLTLFNTQEVVCKSECQFINPKEDQNRELVDEPIFH